MASSKVSDPVSEIETFRDPRGYSLLQLVQKSPSCFNGIVSVYRWRVTVELIEEPVEVITERLEKLFRKADNSYHFEPLRKEARNLGYKFTGMFGQDHKSS
jgi:hypothetical protein